MSRAQRRYVVLCLQGFGDALEATPLVEQLRLQAPLGQIEVVTMRPQVRDLFLGLRHLVDRVVYVPYWELGFRSAFLRAIRLPFETVYEASFLAYPAARAEYVLLSRAIRSHAHYAHDYAYSQAIRLLNSRTTRVPIREVHNVLRNLDLLSAAGFRAVTPEKYVIPEDWYAPRRNSSRVLFHVGSIAHHGLEAKRWPIDRFVKLGQLLQRRGISVSLLSGPAERAETEAIARSLRDAPIVSGSIAHVARELAGFGAMIANDNGMAHLAAGVGIPVVALMGPTPVESGPYGTSAVAFRPSACPPCFDVAKTDMRCALDIDYSCLKRDIRVEDVAELVTSIIRSVGDISEAVALDESIDIVGEQ